MSIQNHLRTILENNKQLAAALMDGTEQVSVANEKTEEWTENSPNYAALMAKQDEINDFMNDLMSDYQGKIADLVAIANS